MHKHFSSAANIPVHFCDPATPCQRSIYETPTDLCTNTRAYRLAAPVINGCVIGVTPAPAQADLMAVK